MSLHENWERLLQGAARKAIEDDAAAVVAAAKARREAQALGARDGTHLPASDENDGGPA